MHTASSARYHLFETSFGVCGIAWTDEGLARVQLPECDDATTAARMTSIGAVEAAPSSVPLVLHSIGALRAYFDGASVDFSALTLDMRGQTAEARTIYAALRSVPWGQTTTYGQLAAAIGAPGAARAVGGAMARNPWPVVVACHRVLTAKQTSGGFSAYGGATTQRRLLLLEGVCLPSVPDPLPDLFG
jgi:methylated-DNA-[protein]-cysteine S-methyltransferase